MKNDTSSPSKLTTDEVQNLADFVLFSQRSCILSLSPVLTRGKVSYPQFFLLEEDCLSMSSIARMMGHSTAAATGMVDKLQTLGHLKRYTAAADRRKIMVRITDCGRELVAQMRNNIAQELSQLMAHEDRAEKMDAAHRVISRHASKAQD